MNDALQESAIRGDRELRLVARYDAPCQTVFEALTRPRFVAEWLPTPGTWSMEALRIDPRVGGAYRYRRVDDRSGRETEIFGSLREVTSNRFFEAIEIWHGKRRSQERSLRCTLDPIGRTTVLTLAVSFASPGARDLAMLGGAEVEAADALERLAPVIEALPYRPRRPARIVRLGLRVATLLQTRIAPLEAS
jgi:uncharacterized protein YndB with AHSA1/START domain